MRITSIYVLKKVNYISSLSEEGCDTKVQALFSFLILLDPPVAVKSEPCRYSIGYWVWKLVVSRVAKGTVSLLVFGRPVWFVALVSEPGKGGGTPFTNPSGGEFCYWRTYEGAVFQY